MLSDFVKGRKVAKPSKVTKEMDADRVCFHSCLLVFVSVMLYGDYCYLSLNSSNASVECLYG